MKKLANQIAEQTDKKSKSHIGKNYKAQMNAIQEIQEACVLQNTLFYKSCE